MRLGSPEHLAIQALWERRLRAEGLAVINYKAMVATEAVWRRRRYWTPEEIESRQAYYEGCLQYLAKARFRRGERKIWTLHATQGLGIRQIAGALSIHWLRVRRVLQKHRKKAGLVSPFKSGHEKPASLTALSSPLPRRQHLRGQSNFAHIRRASTARASAASGAALLRSL